VDPIPPPEINIRRNQMVLPAAAASLITPVACQAEFVGKHIKTSKTKVAWSFYVRKEVAADPAVDSYFEVELLASKTSGKRRLYVNEHLMKEVEGKAASLRFCHAGLVLEVVASSKKKKEKVEAEYDLLIGGQSFSELLEVQDSRLPADNDYTLEAEVQRQRLAKKADDNQKKEEGRRQRGAYPRSVSDQEAADALQSEICRTRTLVSKAPIALLQKRLSGESSTPNSNSPAKSDTGRASDSSVTSVGTASTVSPTDSINFRDPFSTPFTTPSPPSHIEASLSQSPFTFATASNDGSSTDTDTASDSDCPDFLSGTVAGTESPVRNSFVDPFSSVLSSASPTLSYTPSTSGFGGFNSSNAGATPAPLSLTPAVHTSTTSSSSTSSGALQQQPNPFDPPASTVCENPFDNVNVKEELEAKEVAQLRAENEALRLRAENEALKAEMQAQQQQQQQHTQQQQQQPPQQFDLVEYQKQCQMQQYQIQQRHQLATERWSMECQRQSYEQQVQMQYFQQQQQQQQQQNLLRLQQLQQQKC